MVVSLPMSTPPQKKPPKPKPWAQMAQGERDAILEALKDGGFGSELRARYIFNQEGFDVRSNYYHDLDEDKTREMDAIAYRRIGELIPGGVLFHQIVAEVKSGYIWILGEEMEEDFEHDDLLVHSIPRWFEAARAQKYHDDARWQLLHSYVHGSNLKGQGLYTSIHQRSDKGIDAWYEAAERVFKASKFDRSSNAFLATDFALCIPLVVLDGNLLAAKFGPDGELTLEPKEHVQVLFSYASESYKKKEISIHVVTLDALPEFLKRVLSDGVEGSNAGKVVYKSLSEREKHPPPDIIT